jgi:hypothetical protein
MRVFHELVLQNVFGLTSGSGSTATQWYSNPDMNELLGSIDAIHVGGYVAQITGASSTTPLVIVRVQQSQENVNWYERTSDLVNVQAPVGPAEVVFQGRDLDADTQPKLRFARLMVRFAATPNPAVSALIRVWVTGRDYSRRTSSRAQAAAGQAAPGQPAPRAPQTMMR